MPKRLGKNGDTKPFHGRITLDAYLYLNEQALERGGQSLAKTMSEIIVEHRYQITQIEIPRACAVRAKS